MAMASSSCSSLSNRSKAYHVELVEWKEKPTFGPNRFYLVTVAYRDTTGALCTTTLELDDVSWARVRNGTPCIVPYLGRYTLSACP
jgi:hypothetical protein